MKFAIAALVGLVAINNEVSATQNIGHNIRMAVLNNIVEMEEIDTEKESLMLQLNKWDGPEYGEVPAFMDGAETTGGYKRAMPERFDAERDDRFMNSMIKNYAREITADGANTGHYFLNHDDAFAASQEVVTNHMKFSDAKTKAFLGVDDKFEETWNHFDVNHDGLLEVERSSQFFRYLLGNALDIDI